MNFRIVYKAGFDAQRQNSRASSFTQYLPLPGGSPDLSPARCRPCMLHADNA